MKERGACTCILAQFSLLWKGPQKQQQQNASLLGSVSEESRVVLVYPSTMLKLKKKLSAAVATLNLSGRISSSGLLN